jgi:hypothetical protein
MSADKPYECGFGGIVYLDHQSILIAADIKYDSIVFYNAYISIPHPNIRWASPVRMLRFIPPSF